MFQLNAYMYNFSSNDSLDWTITRVNETGFVHVNLNQTNSSILTVERGILDPGKYVVCLKITQMNSTQWYDDCLVLEVILPDLVAQLNGADFITAKLNTSLVIGAYYSDPAENLSSIADKKISCQWSIVSYYQTMEANYAQLQELFQSFTSEKAVQYLSENCASVSLNESLTQNALVVIRFSVIMKTRRADAVQVIKFTDGLDALDVE